MLASPGPVTLSNAPKISDLRNIRDTNMVECTSGRSKDMHISRGVLVRFQATTEDIQRVVEAATRYRGDNRGFYNAISGTDIRKYIRDPSSVRRQTDWIQFENTFLDNATDISVEDAVEADSAGKWTMFGGIFATTIVGWLTSL